MGRRGPSAASTRRGAAAAPALARARRRGAAPDGRRCEDGDVNGDVNGDGDEEKMMRK